MLTFVSPGDEKPVPMTWIVALLGKVASEILVKDVGAILTVVAPFEHPQPLNVPIIDVEVARAFNPLAPRAYDAQLHGQHQLQLMEKLFGDGYLFKFARTYGGDPAVNADLVKGLPEALEAFKGKAALSEGGVSAYMQECYIAISYLLAIFSNDIRPSGGKDSDVFKVVHNKRLAHTPPPAVLKLVLLVIIVQFFHSRSAQI
jgi:hypothetical protein